MVNGSMFLGLFGNIVPLSFLLLACLKLSAVKGLRAAFDISILSPCDAIAVCEGVAVFEKKLASF